MSRFTRDLIVVVVCLRRRKHKYSSSPYFENWLCFVERVILINYSRQGREPWNSRFTYTRRENLLLCSSGGPVSRLMIKPDFRDNCFGCPHPASGSERAKTKLVQRIEIGYWNFYFSSPYAPLFHSHILYEINLTEVIYSSLVWPGRRRKEDEWGDPENRVRFYPLRLLLLKCVSIQSN